MRKIPTLFVRHADNRKYVTEHVTDGCEWVLAGEGVATRKYDGTCVMCDDDGRWWARREVKAGKPEPENYVAVEQDETTGKTVGWEPIEQSSFAKFFDEAERDHDYAGTYELCGPKINGNPEGYDKHVLVRHDDASVIEGLRLSYDGLRTFLTTGYPGEGIVWHHPDGRMAKLKRRDFA